VAFFSPSYWLYETPQQGGRLDALTFAHRLVDALEEHKGENIVLLDLHNLAPFADYFIICSGSNDRLLDALARTALDEGRAAKIHGRVEGDARSGWILVDFGDVIVHLFTPELREYYRLEDLWAEGKALLHIQ